MLLFSETSEEVRKSIKIRRFDWRNKEIKKQTPDQDFSFRFFNDKILDYEEIKRKYEKYAGKLHRLLKLEIINERWFDKKRKKLNNWLMK